MKDYAEDTLRRKTQQSQRRPVYHYYGCEDLNLNNNSPVISDPSCPFCDEASVLRSDGCQTCGVAFVPILVVDGSPASIRLFPQTQKITLKQLIGSLAAPHIPISKCPACKNAFTFNSDKNGKLTPYCPNVYLPITLQSDGKLLYTCREVETTAITNEIASMLLPEYCAEIERLFKTVFNSVTSADTAVLPHTAPVETPSSSKHYHKKVQNKVLNHLSDKASATLQELIGVTGSTKQGVSQAIKTMIETGDVYRVKRGVYALSKRQ